MNRSGNIPEVDPAIPAGAVSVYGQGDAMDDFPVLKAFQQYVDAEHAKAQKRMTTLCIFFVVMMLAVIGVFVMLLMNISQRNNTLSDQLLAYMMKDHDRGSIVVQPSAPSQGDAALKAVTESLAAMQREMLAQQNRLAEERLKLANEALARASAPAPAVAGGAASGAPVPESERAAFARAQREHEKEVKADALKLRRSRDMLKAEREKLAKEREELRQREIELQRRRMYPELYEKPRVSARAASGTRAQSQPAAARAAVADVVEQDDYDAETAAIDAEIEALEREQEAAKAHFEAAAAAHAAADAATADDGAIRYFDDEEEPPQEAQTPVQGANIPMKIGNTSSEWSIPMD